jgi:hypothetical protein
LKNRCNADEPPPTERRFGNLWHTNAFHPERFTLAYSDSLLGYAPAGVIGSGPTAAVARYNVLLVLAFALASIGGYALVRQLGGSRVARPSRVSPSPTRLGDSRTRGT